MSLAWLSLGALIAAIVLSCVTELNIGVLAIALAWIVGVSVGHMKLDEVLGGFPVQLVLMLAGVTLLFAQAQLNGTLDRVAHRAVRLCRGNVGLIPMMFFVLGAGIASIGPGNIATSAMLAPMAMAIAARAGIPFFLMAIMVGNGAQSGSLSPFAPTGIIVNGLMTKLGLPGHEWWNFWSCFVAHAAVASSGYLVLGGWRLFGRAYDGGAPAERGHGTGDDPFTTANWVTVATIVGVMVAVLFAQANIGMAAFAGAVVLAAVGVADHEQALRKVPWGVILMVGGVTVLIGLLEKTGGLTLFTAMLARLATKDSLTGVIAFVTGLISVYSSTSGVVLPAFLPTIPGLVERLGGGDPLAIAASMNIGSHLVDISPLSTVGAICIAAIPVSEGVKPTYRALMAWGLSMTVVGGIGCYLFL